MNWKSIEYFLHVAKVGNITVASRDLGIVQPALSRHIRRLEKEVGFAVFDRLPTGVRLTDAGQRLHECCRTIVQQLAQMRNGLSAEPPRPEGEVRLGLTDTLTADLAARLVERLNAEAPGVRLCLMHGDGASLAAAVLAGRLPLAVVSGPVDAPNCDVLPLGREPMALFGTARVLPASAYTVADISGLPMVVCSGLRSLLERQLFQFGERFRVEVEADSMDALRGMVLRGIGPTLLPVSALRDEVESGALRTAPVANADLHRVVAILQPRHAPTPAAAAVIRAVRAEVVLMLAEGILPALLRRRGSGADRQHERHGGLAPANGFASRAMRPVEGGLRV